MGEHRPPEHGGDWAGYRSAYGALPLDFSANLNPFGMPDAVRRAAASALAEPPRYPDPLCRALRAAIAAWEHVDENWCLCGAGAADLIYRAVLARRPRRALVTAPSFSEYEAALSLTDCAVERYVLRVEDGFLLREDFLDAIVPGTDMVFLCEPNNPTGRTTDRALLAAVLARCREAGALLVVDECFGEFLDDPASHTMKPFLDGSGHLLILKAFTKLWAMAGLRLGYCLCDDGAYLAAMGRAGPPWAVSAPAQAAGLAALTQTETGPAVRAFLAKERPWLAAQLTALRFHVVPGEANYLLFYAPRSLLEPLARRGILLRGCAGYHGLGEGWYRAAVRLHEENERLIGALREICWEEEE